MLDHHIVERYPNHAHIYLSSPLTSHLHFYQVGHPHVHKHAGATLSPQIPTQDSSGNTGVVYLTSNDGLDQSVTALAFNSLHVEVVYPTPDDRQLLLGIGEGDGLPPEAFVAPPRKPPRV